MSNLFLLNEAIDHINFNNFKAGMVELLTIDKENDHVFRKHSSIYDLPIYEILCMNYGQEEQTIITFIEQFVPCSFYIDNEDKANHFCGSTFNAFLGIDFTNTSISKSKQIINNLTYKNWSYLFLSNIDKLQYVLENHVFSSIFEKDFRNLNFNAQLSIIDEFVKAKKRGLVTPYYPDTKIIKDVTPKNSTCKVLELRVYAPNALRVYFNESQGKVYLSGIDLKSNPDQSEDINSAQKILKNLLKL